MIQYGGRTSMLAVCAALALVAFIVSIAWSARLSNVVADHRAQFALSIVVYNIVFHFFYRANGQPFIFTMHTVFALTLLLAFAYEASAWRWRSTALASALALLVVNNAVFVGFVDRALAKECIDFAGHVCLTWAPPVDSARFYGGVAEFRQSADYPFELGRVAFTEDKLDESIALLQRALSMDQDHELAQLYLGAALIRANRIDDAIAYLTAALQRNPSNGNLRRLLLVAQQRAIKS
jgi:tetratricopeptide (TPR) repeat protein